MLTSLPIGAIFPVIGVYNSFGDYTELNIYPIADWAKFCDGSVINDPDSPLDGTYVPDLTSSNVPVGAASAGTITPQRQVVANIYAFGFWNVLESVFNTENQITARYFMRIK
jgi:hypothetical protein